MPFALENHESHLNHKNYTYMHTFIILLLIFIGKYAVTCNIFVINFFFKVNTSLIISRLNQVRVSVHC